MSSVQVDLLDMHIVKQITLGRGDSPRTDRASVEEMAGQLGVHPNTVAARIRGLAEREVFLPMTVQVLAPSLGIEMAHVFFPVPSERRTPDLVKRFQAAHGRHYFLRYAEGWTLVLYGPSLANIQSTVADLERDSGVKGEWDIVMSRDFPANPRVPLDHLDLRILGALLADARTPLNDLAQAIDVPARTVRRRHDALFERKVLRYLPGGAKPVSGVALGYVIFDLPSGLDREATVNATHPYVREAWSGRIFERKAHFWTYAATIADLSDRVAALRGVPGVTNLRARILERYDLNPNLPAQLVDIVESASRIAA